MKYVWYSLINIVYIIWYLNTIWYSSAAYKNTLSISNNYIWATAFNYDDEDKMWRQAGFVEMLVSPAKRDQNEMGGLQKRGRFKTLWIEIKTRSLTVTHDENEVTHDEKVPKPEKRD